MLTSTPTPTRITLRQGLEAYYERFPGLTRLEPEDPGAELFIPHDVCHVVFGLGTSLVEEILVDVWTKTGTDIPIRTYAGYAGYIAQAEPLKIVRQFGWWSILREFWFAMPYAWRVWRAAKAMKKPWFFRKYKDYLDQEIDKIREEFGIRVIDVAPRHHRFSTVL